MKTYCTLRTSDGYLDVEAGTIDGKIKKWGVPISTSDWVSDEVIEEIVKLNKRTGVNSFELKDGGILLTDNSGSYMVVIPKYEC